MDYKNAGVDIEAGYRSVELMKKHIAKTMRPEVLGGIGGFSGAFSMKAFKDMEEPTLVSGTDGCGTKVKLAMVMDKHDTIGIDAVAMCVNDIACAGRRAAVFPRLYCLRQELSGKDRRDRRGRSGRLPSVRSRSDRRRDCGASGTYGRG